MTKCTAPVDPESIVIPKKPANKSASEHRKITKPIMEKRRRARINHSLEQLKSILMEQFSECAKNKNNNLEKADILELTVKYLKDITAKCGAKSAAAKCPAAKCAAVKCPAAKCPAPAGPATSAANLALMQNGFKQCKAQVTTCLAQMDKKLNERLASHLAKFEKQQFDVQTSKFDCDQVLNLSINEHLLLNNNYLLHTPSSACSTSSSSVFFPQGGSLSPGSERSLSPTSMEQVWRPW